jgi:hypothetical protein
MQRGTRQRNLKKIQILFLCRVLCRGTLGKVLKNIFFTECPAEGHSAKHPLTFRAPSRQLFFAECRSRVPDKKHSVKRSLPTKFLPCTLCRVRHSVKPLPRAKCP